MTRVVFESKSAPPLSVEVPDGGRLIDVCDEVAAPVPFDCRSASCGTCRIDVLEGASELLPPEDDELSVLDLFGDDPARRRLACQARIKPGIAVLRVRATDE
jgi:ferredoxin